jgi:predicted O-methyltransferase YrrM
MALVIVSGSTAGSHSCMESLMSQERWEIVDRYLTDLLLPSDPALSAALADSAVAGLPAINVSPPQGKFLHLLARIRGARNILEIGTLGGYSTIWLARALPPGGRLVTLESEAKHAEIARANIARAGLNGIVELRLGRAIETLPQLAAENYQPFDMVFIDADKPSTPEYFSWALRLTQKGSIIVVDNVVRKGAVADQDSTDASVKGIQHFLEVVASEPRISATAIQTVGIKGYDGFALLLVTS